MGEVGLKDLKVNPIGGLFLHFDPVVWPTGPIEYRPNSSTTVFWMVWYKHSDNYCGVH